MKTAVVKNGSDVKMSEVGTHCADYPRARACACVREMQAVTEI
jgi:hypothetical protein